MTREEGIIKNLYQRYLNMIGRVGKKGSAYEYTYCSFTSFTEYLEAVTKLERSVENGKQCYSFKDFCSDPKKYDIDKDATGLGYTPEGIRILLKQTNRHGVIVLYNGIEYPALATFITNCPLPDNIKTREHFKTFVNGMYKFYKDNGFIDSYDAKIMPGVQFMSIEGNNATICQEHIDLVKKALE